VGSNPTGPTFWPDGGIGRHKRLKISRLLGMRVQVPLRLSAKETSKKGLTKMPTITVTENQLQIISQACELFSRIGVGQWSEIEQHLPLREGQMFIPYEEKTKIDAILTPYLDDCRTHNSSNAWDIYQVIRHRTAWLKAQKFGRVNEDGSRNWDKMMEVDYDEPVHFGSEPLIKVEEDKNSRNTFDEWFNRQLKETPYVSHEMEKFAALAWKACEEQTKNLNI
jgi:hypothetical protein